MEDALEELRDWGEDMDDDACEDGDSDDDDVASEAEREQSLEEMLAGMTIDDAKRLPSYRTDLVDLLNEAFRRIDLVIKLCTATAKRRVRKAPFQSSSFEDKGAEKLQIKNMETLGDLISIFESLQSTVDDLAGAFYALNASLVRHLLTSLTSEAEKMAEQISIQWNGEKDDFTTWTHTWKKLINKNALPSDIKPR